MAPDIYQQRLEVHQREAARARDVATRCEQAARVLFIVGGMCVAGVWVVPEEAWLAGSVGLVLVAVAGVVTVLQTRAEFRAAGHRRVAVVNANAVARKQRDWASVRQIPVSDEVRDSPLVRDLDVVGEASLLNLCCTAETEQGIDTLTGWLLEATTIVEIERRQSASEELAEQLDWRQQFQGRCRLLSKNQTAVDRLIEFTDNAEIVTPKWVLNYALVAPLLLVLFVGLWTSEATAVVGFVGIAATLVVNVLLTVTYSGQLHSLVQEISPDVTGASSELLSPPFTHLAGLQTSNPVLSEAVSIAGQATGKLKQLERYLLLANLARNPFTVFLLYLPLQFACLWDFHVGRFLYRWQERVAGKVRPWFDTLGEVEALASLASVRFDHPDWTYPRIEKSADTFRAKSLGHPLLPNEDRVGNDVAVGPCGSVLLVTGSNMAGKSTLMRSIGLNALLAQAGAPCCCSELTMPPVTILTCMRVADSLQRGESLFMAELLRLKYIVETIDSVGPDAPLPLYLLDEILSGTNSDERRVAVESVIGHIAKSRAIGAVSTHDLQLARESKVSDAFQHVHFRETFSDDSDTPELHFDYQIREGIATTTNALKLVRMIGLPVE